MEDSKNEGHDAMNMLTHTIRRSASSGGNSRRKDRLGQLSVGNSNEGPACSAPMWLLLQFVTFPEIFTTLMQVQSENWFEKLSRLLRSMADLYPLCHITFTYELIETLFTHMTPNHMADTVLYIFGRMRDRTRAIGQQLTPTDHQKTLADTTEKHKDTTDGEAGQASEHNEADGTAYSDRESIHPVADVDYLNDSNIHQYDSSKFFSTSHTVDDGPSEASEAVLEADNLDRVSQGSPDETVQENVNEVERTIETSDKTADSEPEDHLFLTSEKASCNTNSDDAQPTTTKVELGTTSTPELSADSRSDVTQHDVEPSSEAESPKENSEQEVPIKKETTEIIGESTDTVQGSIAASS
eukprot:Filipodium_phascolosomae@DN2269_c0_g1_i2.p1